MDLVLPSKIQSILMPIMDKPGTIYLGGAANVFGTTIAELSGANEYTYGEKGEIYTGKQLNELANDLSKDDVLGAIDKTWLL